MTNPDAPRCDRTVDVLGHIPCNAPLPCKHHPPVEQVKARIRDMQTTLKEGHAK